MCIYILDIYTYIHIYTAQECLSFILVMTGLLISEGFIFVGGLSICTDITESKYFGLLDHIPELQYSNV